MKIVNAIIKRDNKVLTIKRKKEPWPGMYGLPGGHIEDGESEKQALIRELKEETCFDIEVQDYVGKGYLNYHSKIFEVLFFTAKIIGGSEQSQDEEIEEIKWLGLEEFCLNLEKHHLQKKEIDFIRQFTLKAPNLN